MDFPLKTLRYFKHFILCPPVDVDLKLWLTVAASLTKGPTETGICPLLPSHVKTKQKNKHRKYEYSLDNYEQHFN